AAVIARSGAGESAGGIGFDVGAAVEYRAAIILDVFGQVGKQDAVVSRAEGEFTDARFGAIVAFGITDHVIERERLPVHGNGVGGGIAGIEIPTHEQRIAGGGAVVEVMSATARCGPSDEDTAADRNPGGDAGAALPQIVPVHLRHHAGDVRGLHALNDLIISDWAAVVIGGVLEVEADRLGGKGGAGKEEESGKQERCWWEVMLFHRTEFDCRNVWMGAIALE